MQKINFEVRDLRQKDQYITDDIFLNGYARYVGIYAVGVYGSLCRHANKEQKSWPSIEKIAIELNVGRNSVIEAIKRLEFWNIIKKIRIGKTANNRYVLGHKKNWKKTSEVYLKEFSEVYHINFSSLPHKLHKFTTQTSNSKELNSKELNSKVLGQEEPAQNILVEEDVKKDPIPKIEFKTGKQYILDVKENDPRYHVRLIAFLMEVSGKFPENKKQFGYFVGRLSRSAKRIEAGDFSGNQITKAVWDTVALGKKLGFDPTMETVEKTLFNTI